MKELKKLKHHQITNIDKTIQELTNRLDIVHPYSASSTSNHQNRNVESLTGKVKKLYQ